MEDIDDDFCDLYEELYAEVELQASSAINCLPSVSQSYLQNVDDSDNENSRSIPNIVGSRVEKCENEVIVDEGSSDSEDDLNIVLNNNPRNADQFQGKIHNQVPSASNSNGNNGINMNQSGHNFLLPRSRSIVDVNVDTLEPKPWRQPGVDISDFFNFGFNEDNWKSYCKDLQKGRAIHVKESSSISEPQACVDLKCPPDRDSDVIEIKAHNSREDSPGSIKEKLDQIDNSKHEADRDRGGFYIDDSRDNNISYSSELHSKYSDDEYPEELGDRSTYIERLQGFDFYNGGKFSSRKESDLFPNYSGERFSNHQVGLPCTKYQSGFFFKKENERGARWKRKEEEEESRFRKTMKDYSFRREPRRRYDDFTRGKYKKSFHYNSRNRDNWEIYSRGKFKNPERSKRRYGSPPIHMDNFVNTDHRYCSSCSCKERYAAKRWHSKMSPRNRVDEKHGRYDKYRSQTWSKRFDGKHGYGHFGRINDERHVLRSRCKLIREGNRGNPFDRSCNVIRRGNREQTLRSCGGLGDSDIVVREGKCTLQSSRRCSDGGSLMYEGKHEKMDSNVGLELKALNDFNESLMDKVVEAENPKIEENQNREEWIDDKIPVTQQKEALDIEEGQIIPEETSESSIDYISAWFKDPITLEEQSGLGMTSNLWMI